MDKVNVDFYQLSNGERIHPVSMWHRHKTRAIDFLKKEYPGIKHITDEYQYRYLYILNKGLRAKFLKRNALTQRGVGANPAARSKK